MFWWAANLFYSPMHWLWDNIINRSIYGVRLWQIAVVMILVTLFYRVVLYPTLGGYTFSPSVPTNKANIRAFESSKKSDNGGGRNQVSQGKEHGSVKW